MLFYDLLYFFLIVLTIPFWGGMFFKKSYRSLLKRRFVPDMDKTGVPSIWIHAVSVGEVKSINQLIKRLVQNNNKRIVLSVTTPAGYAVARTDYPDITVIPSPLDFSFVIRLFIRRINPSILILNELEIWPNWITVADRMGIPITVINGRISENAFKRYRLFWFLLKRFFRKIDLFLVQAEIYRQKFLMLSISENKLAVCGNIKADEAIQSVDRLPSEGEVRKFLKLAKGSKHLVVVSSSHRKDEQMLFPVIRDLEETFSFIIVPRHLERIPDIKKMLQSQHISCRVWSETDRIDLDSDVLIFDQMGYLHQIQKVSDVVFMGGTFDRKIGSHNLYEPAALGKPIIGGPFFNNFPDVGDALVSGGVYRQVHDADDIRDSFLSFGTQNLIEIKKTALGIVSQRKGSVECIFNQIQPLIK